jgi:hypothetical protein
MLDHFEAPTDFLKGNLVVRYETIKKFRRNIGNIDNDLSFIGCLFIKEFLNSRYNFAELNICV